MVKSSTDSLLLALPCHSCQSFVCFYADPFSFLCFQSQRSAWQAVFPRRRCPLAAVRFGQWEIGRRLEGTKEDGGGQSTSPPPLCFEWHLQWAAPASPSPTFPGFLLSGSLDRRVPAATCSCSPSLFRFSALSLSTILTSPSDQVLS